MVPICYYADWSKVKMLLFLPACKVCRNMQPPSNKFHMIKGGGCGQAAGFYCISFLNFIFR